jgi:amidophosphoribosyltransferase
LIVAQDTLKHYCGVVGIYSSKEINLPEKLFYGLFAQQHRGQESAGIAYRNKGHLVTYKDVGMVSEVLAHYLNENHPSQVGIGHVRYSTHGGNKLENAQPISVSCNKGEIALAHNGNISNTIQIKDRLTAEGSIFQSTSDTELMLHLIARSRKLNFEDALFETLAQLEGAFSMVMIHDDKLYAMRDPNGFRPLYIAEDDGLIIFASESCALETLGMKNYRSVEPGEIIRVDEEGVYSQFFAKETKRSQCVFELIYFARPDSQVFDKSVHLSRKKMGAALAELDNVEGDIVVPVPDSGNSAALGYAEASGLPLDHGLTRNHYMGRSFIMPTTSQREFAVRMKLHPVKEVIAGKRIILIDDSLVRGTTSKILVKLLKEAGAKEVHLRLSSPEIKFPCYFGIDIPTSQELISNRLSPEQIAEYIGADSVLFLDQQKLAQTVGKDDGYCYACFSGNYPIEVQNASARPEE